MTRAGLRDLAVTVLKASSTLAGQNVLGVSVAPTKGSALNAAPVLLVQTPTERKTSIGKSGPPKFTTSVSLTVVARLANLRAEVAEADIDTLIDQVHAAVLGSYDLNRVVQQFVEVDTSMVITAEASQPIAEAAIHFHCHLFQRYEPPRGEPLTSIDAKIQTPPGPVLAEALITLPQN